MIEFSQRLNSILENVLVAVLTAAIIGLFGYIKSDWIISALGGATESDLQALKAEVDSIKYNTKNVIYSDDGATHISAESFQFSFHTDGSFIGYGASKEVLFRCGSGGCR